jgi:hypothetical protein
MPVKFMGISISTSDVLLSIAAGCIAILISWVDGWSYAVGILNPQSIPHFILSAYGALAIAAAVAYIFVRRLLLLAFTLPALALTLLRLMAVEF